MKPEQEAQIRERAEKKHAYVSTACHHGLHDRCRQECKFCQAKCACDCGHRVAAPGEAAEKPESDWPTLNRERGRLIDKSIAGTITTEEKLTLQALQAYADLYLDRFRERAAAPSPELWESVREIANGTPEIKVTPGPAYSLGFEHGVEAVQVILRAALDRLVGEKA